MPAVAALEPWGSWAWEGCLAHLRGRTLWARNQLARLPPPTTPSQPPPFINTHTHTLFNIASWHVAKLLPRFGPGCHCRPPLKTHTSTHRL